MGNQLDLISGLFKEDIKNEALEQLFRPVFLDMCVTAYTLPQGKIREELLEFCMYLTFFLSIEPSKALNNLKDISVHPSIDSALEASYEAQRTIFRAIKEQDMSDAENELINILIKKIEYVITLMKNESIIYSH